MSFGVARRTTMHGALGDSAPTAVDCDCALGGMTSGRQPAPEEILVRPAAAPLRLCASIQPAVRARDLLPRDECLEHELTCSYRLRRIALRREPDMPNQVDQARNGSERRLHAFGTFIFRHLQRTALVEPDDDVVGVHAAG